MGFNNGSTGTAHHNVSGQLAIYVGPTNTYRGFGLASISPVGIGTASDGLNNGIRLGTTPRRRRRHAAGGRGRRVEERPPRAG